MSNIEQLVLFVSEQLDTKHTDMFIRSQEVNTTFLVIADYIFHNGIDFYIREIYDKPFKLWDIGVASRKYFSRKAFEYNVGVLKVKFERLIPHIEKFVNHEWHMEETGFLFEQIYKEKETAIKDRSQRVYLTLSDMAEVTEKNSDFFEKYHNREYPSLRNSRYYILINEHPYDIVESYSKALETIQELFDKEDEFMYQNWLEELRNNGRVDFSIKRVEPFESRNK